MKNFGWAAAPEALQISLVERIRAHQLPGQTQGKIQAGEPAGSLVQGAFLFLGRVRGVIRDQNVDKPVFDGAPQGFAVFGRAQGGLTLAAVL